MTVRSMTGFGRGEDTSRGFRAEVELSSVNRKQLDVRLNLPRPLASLESRIVREIGKCVSRGCVVGSISVTAVSAVSHKIKVDNNVAAAYVLALRKLAKKHGLKDDLTARSLLNLPDVVKLEKAELDANVAGPVVVRAVRHALVSLVSMRDKEGKALKKDVNKRLRILKAKLVSIEKRSSGVVDRYRQKLGDRLAKAGLKIDGAGPEISRELALFADRCDIAEEITRLKSHLSQATELLSAGEPVGRTLDFVVQEMLREINTIGSKANDTSLSRFVIDFKSELERVREQIQNVE